MTLQTKRLILRPFAPEDEEAFVAGIGDGELRRLYGLPAELSDDTARRIFAKFSTLPGAMSLVRRGDGAMVGFLLDVPAELPEHMLHTLPEGGRTLAFATFSPYQRQGYMREAIGAWMERHNQAQDAPYLHGGHFLFNGPSRRLLTSLGFTPYGQHDLGTVAIVDEIRMLQGKREGQMNLQTKRLILRRWQESDAEDLYLYARDPEVGPIAGWPPHQSVEESLHVIRNVLSGPEAYALCMKEDGRAIGAIELKLKGRTDLTDRDDECELGYWLGKPFWGRGLMPEAARELLRRAFEDLGMAKVWCGYYDGNEKSKRVQEKVGFRYMWTTPDVDVPLMDEKRIGHVNCLTKEEWLQKQQEGE